MKKFITLIMVVMLLLGSTQQVLATEINSTEINTSEVESADETTSDAFVIVLDPGHDSNHGGARGNGLSETALNLKIAQYCYEELCTYSNVKVYMTRYSSECPYPETLGVYLGSRKDNTKRVEFAASVGADAYVALHLNSNMSASVSGAEVYIPNTQYRPEVGQAGRALGQSILTQLGTLGLTQRGLFTRWSEDGTYYEDGSLADYYGVIKRAKDFAIPGIIVEHAFISNASDCANYLSTDAQLKALGVADATGIANYFGLVKDGTVLQPDTLHTVKFMHDGQLISTQYVRHGYSATLLDEEELEVINLTYGSSLDNITEDTIIQIDYEPAPEPEPVPQPEPEPETESETESEQVSDSEAESELGTETGVDTETQSELEEEIDTTTEEMIAPEETEDVDNPQNHENPFLWIWGIVLIILVLAIGGVFTFWWYKKKKVNHGEQQEQ